MSDPKQLLFLSHAAIDEEIAKFLKQHIEAAVPQIEVFVSSDPEDLAPGDPWIEKILNALKKARLLLCLATERGISRKWVWFETGSTWYLDVRCIPCCLGRIRKGELPAPFAFLQALNLDESDDVRSLFRQIENTFGNVGRWPDISAMKDALIRLDVRAEERQSIQDDPDASELRAEIARIMKTLDAGSKEAIRQVLIHGEMSDDAATKKVIDAGLKGPTFKSLVALEIPTGWLSKTRSSPDPGTWRGEDCYVIKPKIAPYLREYFEKQRS